MAACYLSITVPEIAYDVAESPVSVECADCEAAGRRTAYSPLFNSEQVWQRSVDETQS